RVDHDMAITRLEEAVLRKTQLNVGSFLLRKVGCSLMFSENDVEVGLSLLGSFAESAHNVKHTISHREVLAMSRPVRSGIKPIPPAYSCTRIVGLEVICLDFRGLLQHLGYHIGIHGAYNGMVNTRGERRMIAPPRVIYTRPQKVGMCIKKSTGKKVRLRAKE